MKFHTLAANFTFAQFREASPLDELNIWGHLLDRNSERIGVKRREAVLENLEKIVLATFRLANTVGFSAMTLRDLCRETGLSMGGLYGYIENKEQLAAMIEDMVRHVAESIPTWFKHMNSPLDEVECVLRAHIYLSEIFQPWAYFFFFGSRTSRLENRANAKGAQLNLQGYLATLIKTFGLFTPQDTFLLASHCLSMVQDWHLARAKYVHANISADDFAHSVVNFLRTYIEATRERAAC